MCREQGLPLVVVNPAMVLGPGDLKTSGQMMIGFLNGTLPGRVCEDSYMSFVDVRDVGRGEGEHTRRRRKCVNCGFRYSTKEIPVFMATRARPAARAPVTVPAMPARTNQERELQRLRELRGRKQKGGPLFLPRERAERGGSANERAARSHPST